MTNQQAIHVLRESERVRLESARQAAKNTLRVTPGGFATAVDGADRTVIVQLDIHALLRLSREVSEAIAQAQRDDEVAPETLRASSPRTIEPPEKTVPCQPPEELLRV